MPNQPAEKGESHEPQLANGTGDAVRLSIFTPRGVAIASTESGGLRTCVDDNRHPQRQLATEDFQDAQSVIHNSNIHLRYPD